MGDEFLDRLVAATLEERDMVLASGQVSSKYANIKKALGRKIFLPEILQRIEIDPGISFAAGDGYGGLPLAAGLCAQGLLDAVYLRKERKNHGTKDLIEGYMPRLGDIGLITEDVITSGKSVRSAIETVRSTGAAAAYVFCVVLRRPVDIGVPIRNLYTGRDFGIE